MPSSPRANSQARSRVIEQLMADHKRVRKAYRDFQKLDPTEDAERCEAIVRQTLQELQTHTTLEEELLYPLAREALDAALIDEAEVEHESARTLIEQLQEMDSDGDKFAARFTVLCEYVMHHVKEEEKEMFPQLLKARGLDWEAVAASMDERRAELQGEEETEDDAGGSANGGGQGGEQEDYSDDARATQPEPQRESPRPRRRERSLTGLTSSGGAGGRRMND